MPCGTCRCTTTTVSQISTLFQSCTCHGVPLAQLIVKPAALCVEDGLLTPRSTSAVRSLTLFFYIIARVCRSPSVGSRSSQILTCCCQCSFTSNRSDLFFMGPWVPSLAVFPLIVPALSCARHRRRDPVHASLFLHASCGPWCFLSPHARPVTVCTIIITVIKDFFVLLPFFDFSFPSWRSLPILTF